MSRMILVVDADPATLDETVNSLRGSGSDVTTACTFDDARRALDIQRPWLLITAVRLGRFNGLHLVARARGLDRDVAAIVVGDESDLPLRADAAELGASFAVRPLGESLLTLVDLALDRPPL